MNKFNKEIVDKKMNLIFGGMFYVGWTPKEFGYGQFPEEFNKKEIIDYLEKSGWKMIKSEEIKNKYPLLKSILIENSDIFWKKDLLTPYEIDILEMYNIV